MAEFEPVKKERELYKQCMTYGKNINAPTINTWRNLPILEHMYNKTYVKWEILDRQLYRNGFGYAFFNIRVIPDPRNSDQNIILVTF